jgi:hypothetical protein
LCQNIFLTELPELAKNPFHFILSEIVDRSPLISGEEIHKGLKQDVPVFGDGELRQKEVFIELD